MPESNLQVGTKEAQELKSYVDPSWKGLLRVSGILLIATAVVWAVVSWSAMILYSSGYPNNPTAYLQLVSQHQLLASTTWSLWIVADFLLIAPTVALYLILRRYNTTFALVGSALSAFFIIYDVAITELNSLTLVSLSQGYASATTDALRASYITAATYGYAALPIQTVLSFAIGTLGYLLWCVPMAKSFIRRQTVIFGAIVNTIGIIGSAAPVVSNPILGLFQFIAVPAVGLWFVLVGAQLYRYASHPAVGAVSHLGSSSLRQRLDRLSTKVTRG